MRKKEAASISTLTTMLCIVCMMIALFGLTQSLWAQEAEEFDIVKEARNAVWSSAAGRLLFSNSRDDHRGFAIYRKRVYVEGFQGVNETILETHPEWVDNGIIRGEFHVPHIERGQYFIATVGFMVPQGTPRTNGVTIKIIFNNTTLYEESKTYTNTLKDIKIDMSKLANQSGTLILEVGANGDSTQDWFVWINPRIGFPSKTP